MHFPMKGLSLTLSLLVLVEVVLTFPTAIPHTDVTESNSEKVDTSKQNTQDGTSSQKEKIYQDEKQDPELTSPNSEVSPLDNNPFKVINPKEKEVNKDEEGGEPIHITTKGKIHGVRKSKGKTGGEDLWKTISHAVGGSHHSNKANSNAITWVPREGGFRTVPEAEKVSTGTPHHRIPQQLQMKSIPKGNSPIFSMLENPDLGTAFPIGVAPNFPEVHFEQEPEPEDSNLVGKIVKEQNELKQMLGQLAIRQENIESLLYQIAAHFPPQRDY